MRFEELGLCDALLEAISYMNYEEATPIQEKAIPKILNGKDLIACAQTGTGKTAAFLLPTLNKLANKGINYTAVLIITPTRELAIQIDQQIQGISYFLDINSIAIYGGGSGVDWAIQKKALTQGTNIIVATPGKLISHLNMGYVKFEKIECLILDEADRMLDMGFYDDIKKIMTYLPEKRQSLLFSATMPPKIRKLAQQVLNNPESVSISISKPAEGILQVAYLAYDNQKAKLVAHLLKEKESYKSIIIFSSSKKKVHQIVSELKANKFEVAAISSDLEQSDREKVLQKFKAKRIRILVATDVISRGIDIDDISLVINYDVPKDAADYVHRVGRTARAGKSGIAITFINDYDVEYFQKIERLIEKDVQKIPIPETLGKGPKYIVKNKFNKKPGKRGTGPQSKRRYYSKKKK